MSPLNKCPAKKLNQVREKPIAIGKFQEPIFRRGEFQNQFIEVEVDVYPISVKDPVTGNTLIGVRFGQMDVIKFVDRNLVYDLKHISKK